MPVAVIGIGQRLRGDDAAGLEAVRLWQSRHSETASRSDVHVACLEGSGLEMIGLLREAEAVVIVDAVCSGAPAGTLRLVREDDIAGRPGDAAAGHGWGVHQVLRLAALLLPDMARRQITLLGIEAEQMGAGTALSRAVADALPALSESIEQHVQLLLRS